MERGRAGVEPLFPRCSIYVESVYSLCRAGKLGRRIGYNIDVFYYFNVTLFSKLYRNRGLGFPKVVVWNRGRKSGLLPTFMGNVFSEKEYRKSPSFPSDTGAKKRGIYPRRSLLRQLPKIFFIAFEPSSRLPLWEDRPTPLLRAILC